MPRQPEFNPLDSSSSIGSSSFASSSVAPSIGTNPLPPNVSAGVHRLENAFDDLADRLVTPGEKVRAYQQRWMQVKALPWGYILLGTFVGWFVIRRLRS